MRQVGYLVLAALDSSFRRTGRVCPLRDKRRAGLADTYTVGATIAVDAPPR